MTRKTLTGVLLDDRAELTITEFSRACRTSTEWVLKLVDEGVLEPMGPEPRSWRFSGASLKRAHTASRLKQDLDINLAGIALALELMDEIDALRERLCRLEAGDA